MGALILEAASAAFSGLLSFLSPCVLPLLPSFLGFLSGSAGLENGTGEAERKPAIRNVLAFSLGFALVFIALGIVFSSASFLFSGARKTISYVSGALIVLLGLNILFDFISFLNMEKRLHLRKPSTILGALLTGIAFGAGWSPCVGPMLASILFLAASRADLPRAVILLASYSAGLALPFIGAGLAFNAVKPLWAFLKRHAMAIRIVSGLLLVAMGLAVAFGFSDYLARATVKAGIGLSAMAVRAPDLARRIFIAAWWIASAAFALPGIGMAVRDLAMKRRPRIAAYVALGLPALAFAVLAMLEGAGELRGASLLGSWFANSGF